MYTEKSITTFRNRLIEARKAKNLSQTALADEIGREFQAIGKWERGQTVPQLDDCVKMCQALGVDLDYLLGVHDIPDNDAKFIADKTGLKEKTAKKILEYNKYPCYSERLAAINKILESERGLRIIERIIQFLDIDPELYLIDNNKKGLSWDYSDDFTIIGASTEGQIKITKKDLPNILLLSIIRDISSWKEHDRNNR